MYSDTLHEAVEWLNVLLTQLACGCCPLCLWKSTHWIVSFSVGNSRESLSSWKCSVVTEELLVPTKLMFVLTLTAASWKWEYHSNTRLVCGHPVCRHANGQKQSADLCRRSEETVCRWVLLSCCSCMCDVWMCWIRCVDTLKWLVQYLLLMTSVCEWGGKAFHNLRLHSVTHSCLQSSRDVTMNRSGFMCPCWILRCTGGWCHRDNMSGDVLADAVCVQRETNSQLWLILNLHHNFYTLNQNNHFINLNHEDEGDMMKVTSFKHTYKSHRNILAYSWW